MGEGKVKTALELAMEKVNAMPKLDADALLEERKKESTDKGEAIAHKYLQNMHHKTDIRSDIYQIEGQQQEFVRSAALNSLVNELSLTQPEQNRHILEGIEQIYDGFSITRFQEKIDRIIDDFQKELQKAGSKVHRSLVDQLQKQGITGTAVTPNLTASAAWREKYAEISAGYTGKLYKLQSALIHD